MVNAHHGARINVAKRILLDRSIFHGAKFDLLKTSPLIERARAGEIEIFLTPMFFEETVKCGLHDKSTFVSHWNFIASINNKKWFKLASEIIAIELGNKLVDEQYYLQFNRVIEHIQEGVEMFIADDVPQAGLDDVMKQITENIAIGKQNRKTRLAMRAQTPPGEYNFQTYFETNVEWFIQKGIMEYHEHSEHFLDIWRRQRHECPFTEFFLKCWLSTLYLPVANHQLKVDENDRADAEQLAFLVWADTMVSDDTRFMKSAFDLLFSGSDKSLMTLPKFLMYLNTDA
jgi:hypothetical protein